jgi:hypothetical protein
MVEREKSKLNLTDIEKCHRPCPREMIAARRESRAQMRLQGLKKINQVLK